jgi:hypothetical protein
VTFEIWTFDVTLTITDSPKLSGIVKYSPGDTCGFVTVRTGVNEVDENPPKNAKNESKSRALTSTPQ